MLNTNQNNLPPLEMACQKWSEIDKSMNKTDEWATLFVCGHPFVLKYEITNNVGYERVHFQRSFVAFRYNDYGHLSHPVFCIENGQKWKVSPSFNTISCIFSINGGNGILYESRGAPPIYWAVTISFRISLNFNLNSRSGQTNTKKGHLFCFLFITLGVIRFSFCNTSINRGKFLVFFRLNNFQILFRETAGSEYLNLLLNMQIIFCKIGWNKNFV